jgi:hypothetical protein
MDSIILLLFHILLFGLPAIIIAKIMFKQYSTFVYSYFGFVFVFSQLLDVIYEIPLTPTVSVTGGDISYASLLLIALFLVIISQNPAIVRTLIAIALILTLFLFILYELINLTLNTPAIANVYSFTTDIFDSLIKLNILNAILFILEILVSFYVFEKLKQKTSTLIGKICLLVLVYIGALSLDGVFSWIVVNPNETDIYLTFISDIVGNIILGLGFAPFLIVFILIERKNFEKFTETSLTLRRFFFRTREELEQSLIKAENEIQALQGLLPICPSCKKVRDDQGYWEGMQHFVSAHSTVQFTNALCPDCMNQTIKLGLSYFDVKLGPKILFFAPDQAIDKSFEDIPSILDVEPNEQFINQSMGDFETANVKFSIESSKIRGNQINFVISYIVKKGFLDNDFAKYLLMDFVAQFTNIPNVQVAFVNATEFTPEMKQEKLSELETMFQSFFKEINDKKTRYYIEQL